MPLTPEDVRNKRFTPVRLREGYDMGEVDQFLDEVESELERLHHENEDLRQKLAAAQRGDGMSFPQPVKEQPPEPVAPPVVQQPPPGGGPQSVADASNAAARLLEIATQNADQLVAESKEQANRILADARARAERMENEARGMASRLEADARTKADQLERETNDKRGQLFGQLEKEKARLQHEVDELRAFERQTRSRLKAYFESQLRVLAGQSGGDSGALPTVEANGPRPLNSHKPAPVQTIDRHSGMERAAGGGGGTPRLNALLEDDDEASL
jgi:DivIVA domain-containing protein